MTTQSLRDQQGYVQIDTGGATTWDLLFEGRLDPTGPWSMLMHWDETDKADSTFGDLGTNSNDAICSVPLPLLPQLRIRLADVTGANAAATGGNLSAWLIE